MASRRPNAKAKRQASHIIASGASLRKSLDRFSDPLAARMYEDVLIRVARSIAKLNVRAIGPAHGLATTSNDSVVIPLDRRGRSRVVIRPRG